jgi:hypothetical protein
LRARAREAEISPTSYRSENIKLADDIEKAAVNS